MSKILTEKEIAKELGLSSWTVRRMRLQDHIANEIDYCPDCMEKLRNMKPGNGDKDG